MATLSKNYIAEAIYLASLDYQDKKKFAEKAVHFFVKKRLISSAGDILERLTKIINKKNGIVAVKISSKEKLKETAKKEIIQILAHRYSAKKIDLQEHIDESLIGGYKIEMDDEVIDLTLKNKIKKLQEHLIQ